MSEALVDDYLDNTIDATGIKQLQGWLLADRAHRDFFTRQVFEHRVIIEHLDGLRACEKAIQAAGGSDRLPLLPDHQPSYWPRWAGYVAAVAALLISLIWWQGLDEGTSQDAPGPATTLTNFLPGLDAAFSNDAQYQVTSHDPANLQVVLTKGTITCQAEALAGQLTIQTNHCAVAVTGTAFSVHADPDASQVWVTEGQVTVAQQQGIPWILDAGCNLTVKPTGMVAPDALWSQQFPSSVPADWQFGTHQPGDGVLAEAGANKDHQVWHIASTKRVPQPLFTWQDGLTVRLRFHVAKPTRLNLIFQIDPDGTGIGPNKTNTLRSVIAPRSGWQTILMPLGQRFSQVDQAQLLGQSCVSWVLAGYVEDLDLMVHSISVY